MAASYKLLSCLFLWIHLLQTSQCHEFNSFGAGFYKEEGLTKHRRRVCTECSEDYEDCENTFWDYYDHTIIGGNHSNLNPWHLSKQHLMLSCVTEDLQNGGDKRRKKRSSQPILKSTIIPIEELRIRDAFSRQRSDMEAEWLLGMRHKPHSRRRVQRQATEDQSDVEVAGVVYMVKAYYGKDYDGSCAMDRRNDYCQMNAFNDKEFMMECNGAHRCWILGIPAWLTDCHRDSDYLHVEYQCIPDDYLYRLNHGVTSDDRPPSSLGYMMSPFYPDYYNHLFLYECYLEMPDFNDDEQKFTFTSLDFHLEPREEGCCIYDFIEIQDISQGRITHRQRICGELDSGHSYSIYGFKARLVFHTDSSWDERGFWIKYAGSSRYGTPDVSVHCAFFKPEDDHLPEESPHVSKQENDCTAYYEYDYYHYDYNDTYWNSSESWSTRTYLPRLTREITSPQTPTAPSTSETQSTTSTPKTSPPTLSSTRQTQPPTTTQSTRKTQPLTLPSTPKTKLPTTQKTRPPTLPSTRKIQPPITTREMTKHHSTTTVKEFATTTQTERTQTVVVPTAVFPEETTPQNSLTSTSTERNSAGNNDRQIEEQTEGSSVNVAVIGGAVGAVAVICAAVILGIVLFRRFRSSPKEKSQPKNNALPSKGAQFNNMNYSKHNFRGDGNEYCGLEPTAPPLSGNTYAPIHQMTSMTDKPVYNNSPANYVDLEPDGATYEILHNEGVYEELPGVSNPGYDSEIPIKPMTRPSGPIPLRPDSNAYVTMNGGQVTQDTYDYIVPTSSGQNRDLPKLPLPKK